MAIYTFLSLNGHEPDASESGAVDAIEQLAGGNIDEAGLAHWIHLNTAGRQGS